MTPVHLAQITSIEGIASDVRQSRITTVVSDGRALQSSSLYECLFRLSGKPVVLRVDGPIFIEDGETIIVIGMYNQDGVFGAAAYHNRSSGASGRSGYASDQQQAILLAGLGVVFVGFVVFMALLMDPRDYGGWSDRLFALCVVLTGLGIALWGMMMFRRYRSKARAIEERLNLASCPPAYDNPRIIQRGYL